MQPDLTVTRRPSAPVLAAARAVGFDRAALGSCLRAGLAALGQDESLAERLLDYLQLLDKWNGVYNLTAVRDPGQMLTQHLFDCLSIVAPLADRLAGRGDSPAGRVVDVGSGAGLPGIVLALCLATGRSAAGRAGRQEGGVPRGQCRQAELALTNLKIAATRVEVLDEAQRQPAPI